MNENRNTFFSVDIKIPQEMKYTGSLKKELDNSIDLILYNMQASNNPGDHFKIVKKDGSRIIYIFKAQTRKRLGQLDRYCKRFLNEKNLGEGRNVEVKPNGLLKSDVWSLIYKLKNRDDYSLSTELETKKDNLVYDGIDIQIFKDYKNWYQWQKDIYNLIYKKNKNYPVPGIYKQPDDRSIYSLVDFEGKSGKSTFFKYIYTRDEENIGRISYGTASQLKSALISIGPKICYILDLPRSKSKFDNQIEIISVIEDLKNGLIFSPMYGKNGKLIMEPPFILISGNELLTEGSLSEDRWRIYELRKDKTLGKVNQLLNKTKTKNKIKK